MLSQRLVLQGVVHISTLNEIDFDIYYEFLKGKFRTGSDRITPFRFSTIKDEQLSIIKKKVTLGTYKFTRVKTVPLPSGRKVSIPTIRDRIVIEYLKYRLKTKYRIKSINRENIIKSVINKLKTGVPYYIIRLDIKDFFPSIPQHKLFQKLKRSSMLSFEEYQLAKSIIKLAGNRGVPQGLSVSNIFSEIYLENFDFTMKKIHPRVNYYCRFVDDILLIINGSLTPSEEKILKLNISETFKKNSLKINSRKEQYINFSVKSQKQVSFEYLGYSFGIKDKSLHISIAQNKIKKILARIDLYFERFSLDGNELLLLERIKYITSKKRAEKFFWFISREQYLVLHSRKIFFGPIETYKEICKSNEIWAELDRYIKRKIKEYKNKGLLKNNAIVRRLHSSSFERHALEENIYKIDKMTERELVVLLVSINPSFNYSSLIHEKKYELIKRYFELVDI